MSYTDPFATIFSPDPAAALGWGGDAAPKEPMVSQEDDGPEIADVRSRAFEALQAALRMESEALQDDPAELANCAKFVAEAKALLHSANNLQRGQSAAGISAQIQSITVAVVAEAEKIHTDVAEHKAEAAKPESKAKPPVKPVALKPAPKKKEPPLYHMGILITVGAHGEEVNKKERHPHPVVSSTDDHEEEPLSERIAQMQHAVAETVHEVKRTLYQKQQSVKRKLYHAQEEAKAAVTNVVTKVEVAAAATGAAIVEKTHDLQAHVQAVGDEAGLVAEDVSRRAGTAGALIAKAAEALGHGDIDTAKQTGKVIASAVERNVKAVQERWATSAEHAKHETHEIYLSKFTKLGRQIAPLMADLQQYTQFDANKDGKVEMSEAIALLQAHQIANLKDIAAGEKLTGNAVFTALFARTPELG